MTRMFSLDHLSAIGVTPDEFVSIAAEAGFAAIGPIADAGKSGLPVVPWFTNQRKMVKRFNRYPGRPPAEEPRM